MHVILRKLEVHIPCLVPYHTPLVYVVLVYQSLEAGPRVLVTLSGLPGGHARWKGQWWTALLWSAFGYAYMQSVMID